MMHLIAKALKDEEINAVAQYYATGRATTVPPPARSPDLVKRGETLATTGETDRQVLPCIGCHGQRGIGEPPFTPYLADQYGQYIIDHPSTPRHGNQRGLPHPTGRR